MRKTQQKVVGEYLLATVLCVFILAVVMQLWKANLRVPFYYQGDAMFHTMVIKGMVDNTWFVDNKFLGMPYGAKLYDFPLPETFHLAVFKLLSFATTDAALIHNLFYLIAFPLITLTSLWVFRQFDISYVYALFGSLLYPFLPYHFIRHQNHLFLSAYYTIPLIVLIVLWICSGKRSLFFSSDHAGKNKPKFSWRNFPTIFSLLVCILLASTGWGYYAFFSCFFLIIAGTIAALNHWNFRYFLPSIILVGVLCAGVFINLLPSLVYAKTHGETQVATRLPAEAEWYGLRISQMVLPITHHRISALAKLKNTYNSGISANENDAASLGLIGSGGFLLLIAWLLFSKTGAAHKESLPARTTLNHLSILNGAAVLLATIGGISSLFALLITPQVRTYNRISIFIAFFSLFAVALCLETFSRRHSGSKRQLLVFHVLLGVVLLGAVYDQTTAQYVPNYASAKAEYSSDRSFISRIEQVMPAGAMVFQLPYVPFPEHGQVHRMSDYDHFRAYLHSKALRWSYGAMKNREGDRWQKNVGAMPPTEFVQALSFTGFSGIYLDRYGYADNGAALEGELSRVLGVEPITSPNARLAFFDLTGYNKGLREKHTDETWHAQQNLYLHPIDISWHGGFSGLETSPENNWRWCSSEGEVQINNNSNRERRITIEMSLGTGHAELSNLRIESPLFSDQLQINNVLKPYSRTITVPTGKHTIRFWSDAPRVNAPADPRFLVFQVVNFKMKEEGD